MERERGVMKGERDEELEKGEVKGERITRRIWRWNGKDGVSEKHPKICSERPSTPPKCLRSHQIFISASQSLKELQGFFLL